VLASLGLEPGNLFEQFIRVDVMGTTVQRKVKNYRLSYNGMEIEDASLLIDHIVHSGDRIDYKALPATIRVGELLPAPGRGRDLKISINNKEFVLPGISGKIILNGKEVDEYAEVSDGDIVRTVAGRDAEAVLVDLFRYISVEPKETAGKKLRLMVNQQEANFTTPLTYGADVRIVFE
jgi:hypothetical protein